MLRFCVRPVGTIVATVVYAVSTGCGGDSGPAGVTRSLAEVPRSRTLVITPWGLDNHLPNAAESYNIYQTGVGHQRESGNKTIYEALMYMNVNTGELIPWQATGFEYNSDYTSVTVASAPRREVGRRRALHGSRREVYDRDARRQRPRAHLFDDLRGVGQRRRHRR